MSATKTAVKPATNVTEFTFNGQLLINSDNVKEVIEGLDTMGYTVIKTRERESWATDMLDDDFGLTTFDAESDSSLRDMIENLNDYRKQDVVDQCILSLATVAFRVHANTDNKGKQSIVDADTEEILEELHRIHGYRLAEVLRTLL